MFDAQSKDCDHAWILGLRSHLFSILCNIPTVVGIMRR